MTKEEARKQLAENLMLLAEALLDDESAGQYKSDEKTGELKVTSVCGNSTTVIAIKNWSYEPVEDEDEWADTIE